jgi:DNA transformation protein and related proteins
MPADPHRLDDLFAAFGPISVRRFFGGEGVYAGELMIGMVFDDLIYLSTDAGTRPRYLAENCRPFTFMKAGERIVTHWYTIPDRLYDDPEELAAWARAALEVAQASPTAQRKRKRAAARK